MTHFRNCICCIDNMLGSNRLASVLIVGILVVLCSAKGAEADPITSWGQAVSAIGSELGVGFPLQTLDATPDGANNPTPNWIKHFIPLTAAASGTYGVGGVGMNPDSTSSGCGSGGLAPCGHLDMYLKFSPTGEFPFQNAVLSTQFRDLDLNPVNDPSFFFETAQFYAAGGGEISPQFSNITGPGSMNGINWNVYQPAGQQGANWPVNIDFSGQGLDDLITDPFWMKLTLRTAPFSAAGTNTPEYLRASLTTVAVPEPEPAGLLLLGVGLFCLGMVIRRGQATDRSRLAVAIPRPQWNCESLYRTGVTHKRF